MIPAALGLLPASTPPAGLATAISAWRPAESMAIAAGPALGRVRVAAFGRRSVFLINVPIGIVLVAAGTRGVPERNCAVWWLPHSLGALAVISGVALLVLGLTKGNNWVWDAASTLGTIAGGVEMYDHPAIADRDLYSADLMHASARGHVVIAAATVRALASRIRDEELSTGKK